MGDEQRRPAALRPSPGALAAVAVGGTLGTLARYGVEHTLPSPASGFPWATFLVNLSGSLLLGIVVTVLAERWPPQRHARPLLAIGLLGAYTTFSTLVVEALLLVRRGHPATAAIYLAVTLVSGPLAVYTGAVVARVGVPGERRRR